MLIGDVFIEVMKRGMLKHTRAARINYHLAFLEEEKDRFYVSFNGKEMSKGN